MRHGLTMIEMLLALGLLSALMLAIASWTQVATQASTRSAAPLRWRAGAEAVLEHVGVDLLAGDFAGVSSRGARRSRPRVELVERVLRVDTRSVWPGGDNGPATHRYIFDSASGELRLERQTARGRRASRLLIDHVGDWKCAIDQDNDLLTVSITSDDGDVVARSFHRP